VNISNQFLEILASPCQDQVSETQAQQCSCTEAQFTTKKMPFNAQLQFSLMAMELMASTKLLNIEPAIGCIFATMQYKNCSSVP